MSNAKQIDFLASGVLGSAGDPLSLGKVYTYEAGSSTVEKTCWLDASKVASATNPIILDAYGKAVIYGDGNYRFIIKTSAGVSVVTLDNFEYTIPTITNKPVRSISASTTLTTSDYLIVVNTAAGNVTLSLPTAIGNSGAEFIVVKTTADGNIVTIDPYLNETIGGAATQTITSQYGTLGFISDNSNWQTTVNSEMTTLVLTAPQINDTTSTHQYIVGVSELAADRIITLPLLTAGDQFVFEAHPQTLNFKTLGSPVIYTPAIHTPRLYSPVIDDGDIGITITSANQTHAAPTVTIPDIVDAADTFLMVDTAQIMTNKHIALKGPQGFLINGKIAVSVASFHLTVAIKTLAGTDPSATDPVYIRIGDTVRTISAALSVTAAAGTNWMNLNSLELSALYQNLFFYLGHNTTDGVVIGFSRIPYAKKYSDFSVTTTNEKFAKISTITTASASDVYENIGRFTARLDGSNNWSIADHPIVQRPIYESEDWIEYGAITVGLGGAIIDNMCHYKIVGDMVWIEICLEGDADGTAFSLTAPFLSKYGIAVPFTAKDNSVLLATPGLLQMSPGSKVITLYTTWSGGAWVAAGTRGIYNGIVFVVPI